ncbi:PEP-utilizing enzyme [Gordonia oryzae]|uniref:PEP-utilizing enzyme n=1 Tax=Gordonia oryzae TaxID=2487349 RepID=UPI001C8494BE|nr:PEP-utilizing enzyme [Gordonia oryzae]
MSPTAPPEARLAFDGAGEPTDLARTVSGATGAGPAVAVRFSIEITAAAAVWDMHSTSGFDNLSWAPVPRHARIHFAWPDTHSGSEIIKSEERTAKFELVRALWRLSHDEIDIATFCDLHCRHGVAPEVWIGDPGVRAGIVGPDDGTVMAYEATYHNLASPSPLAVTVTVTTVGSTTNHAAVVYRELGLSCVPNTRCGTIDPDVGMRVSADGSAGVVNMLSTR